MAGADISVPSAAVRLDVLPAGAAADGLGFALLPSEGLLTEESDASNRISRPSAT
jgi:hypothetical protein